MSYIPGSKWFKNWESIDAITEAAQRTNVVNASLFLGKYVYWSSLYDSKPRQDKATTLKTLKGIRSPLSADDYSHLRGRKNKIHHPNLHAFRMKTQSRISINLGNESILETDISLHPLFGFPVLPGSAIKGITRHYVEEKQLFEIAEIIRLFGHQPDLSGNVKLSKGDVIFLDAWPLDFDQAKGLDQYLDLDVMNPHFAKYYRGDEWPADNDNPVPIPFPVIRPGVRFEFAVGLGTEGKKRSISDGNKDLVRLEGCIRKALSEYGLGAKTGSGYGYFRP